MQVEGDWLKHSGTQSLCAALSSAGYRALFVGGCVRNSLMGLAVTDIDISTDALPEAVTSIAERVGFRVVPTGIAHGTVTVIAHHRPHEVTTFRRDVSTDGRRASVVFSNNLTEDAARRDFTMNALYAQANGEVVDPLGGLPDLISRRLRFVGDPEARIREDYLRILRFFRFYAIYGDPREGIDSEGLAACASNLEGLTSLSRERIGSEVRKLLSAADPAPAIASMAHSGVLGQILPAADHRAVARLVHLESGSPPDWKARLAVLGGENLAEALRLSKAEATAIEHIRSELGTPLSPAALAWKFGVTVAQAVVLCRAALLESPLPSAWLHQIERGAIAIFPVEAKDLMPGFSGKALGERLREIEERWLASDLKLGKAALLA